MYDSSAPRMSVIQSRATRAQRLHEVLRAVRHIPARGARDQGPEHIGFPAVVAAHGLPRSKTQRCSKTPTSRAPRPAQHFSQPRLAKSPTHTQRSPTGIPAEHGQSGPIVLGRDAPEGVSAAQLRLLRAPGGDQDVRGDRFLLPSLHRRALCDGRFVRAATPGGSATRCVESAQGPATRGRFFSRQWRELELGMRHYGVCRQPDVPGRCCRECAEVSQ